MAEIRPHETVKYTYRQSRFKNVPELPTRAIVVAPSTGGKTTLMVSLILDIYIDFVFAGCMFSHPLRFWMMRGSP